MKHRTLAKLGGFVIAATCTAGLVAFAATNTGAYFTDSKTGTYNASSGTIGVTLDPSNGALDFTNGLPGVYKTQTVTYKANTTSPDGEDIWLVFHSASQSGNWSEAFTGRPDDDNGGGLGRFGHLKVTSDNPATYFESNNLSSPRTLPPIPVGGYPVCNVDSTNGWGGSTQVAATATDFSLPYCSPVHPILLASALPNGATQHAYIEFGYTPITTGPQAQSGYYTIIATQHGISPSNVDSLPLP